MKELSAIILNLFISSFDKQIIWPAISIIVFLMTFFVEAQAGITF